MKKRAGCTFGSPKSASVKEMSCDLELGRAFTGLGLFEFRVKDGVARGDEDFEKLWFRWLMEACESSEESS